VAQLENPDWKPEPLLISVCQAAVLIGVSERTVKNLLKRGELVRRKVGRRTLIPRTSIQAFLKKDHSTRE
jgi:excisionase family DNA binding protein